jgi:hypothetical protein
MAESMLQRNLLEGDHENNRERLTVRLAYVRLPIEYSTITVVVAKAKYNTS